MKSNDKPSHIELIRDVPTGIVFLCLQGGGRYRAEKMYMGATLEESVELAMDDVYRFGFDTLPMRIYELHDTIEPLDPEEEE